MARPACEQILFLPGALGRTALWEPVAGLLACPAREAHVGGPGFGSPASLLPQARLRVVENGDYDLAETHAAEVAPLIDEFLRRICVADLV